MKKVLKILVGVFVLLALVPFVPPIYNKVTKPLCKNYMDQWEWYKHVDANELRQVREYCERRGFNTDYYVLVDFSIPSGKRRFFIYDLKKEKGVLSSYCMHGSGKGNTDAKPKFSNSMGERMLLLGSLHHGGQR